ncbi:MAG: hypothetical protein IT453_06285 [Planctomycetes bacterium]|nr:hypothetical protein [Planctomycetota bacterium]
MIQGEKNPPARKPGQDGSVACEKARTRLQHFLGGDQPISEDRALRAHLERCETCNQHYRDSLLLTARIARERRLLRESREQRGELALPEETVRTSKLRRFRAIVMPMALLAGLAFLFQFDGVARRVDGRLLEGRATTAGRDFDAEVPRELVRGEWLETDAGSRLAVESEGTRLELLGGSRLLVEEPRDLRFRLQSGRVELDGPCSLRGAFGAIECLGGKASLEVEPGFALLQSDTAELELVDAGGTRRVAPGERVELVLARR